MLKNRRSSTPTKDKHSPGKSSSSSLTAVPSPGPDHWSSVLRETVLVAAGAAGDAEPEPELHFVLEGGADEGRFPFVGRVFPASGVGVSVVGGADLAEGDVLLEIQGQRVSGYTGADVRAWLRYCMRNENPVVIRSAREGRRKEEKRKASELI